MLTESRINRQLGCLEARLKRCLRGALLGRQVFAELMLGVVWLHVLAKRMQETNDLNERRAMQAEFTHGLGVAHHAMNVLLKESKPPKTDNQDYRPEHRAA